MSKIVSTGIAVPDYVSSQENILKHMCKAYNDESASRKLRILFHSSGINTRHSVVADFSNRNGDKPFFGNGWPNVEQRMSLYRKHAAALALKAIENMLGKLGSSADTLGITHLITVTCTGIYAPGLETELMEKLDLPHNIFHTSINFLGCNAAFPAQKIADSFVGSDKNAKVLVVCVELCTIHFQPKDNTDNLLSNTIFADGAAALLFVSDEYARQHKLSGFRVEGFYSGILGEGKALMGWNVKPLNFEMILNAEVPAFIGKKIKGWVADAEKHFNLKSSEINKWAVHPGGRKILDQVRQQLGFENGELNYSYQILRDYGNMSSPTVLFILNLIETVPLVQGEKIMAVGFGPGISVDAALYYYEK